MHDRQTNARETLVVITSHLRRNFAFPSQNGCARAVNIHGAASPEGGRRFHHGDGPASMRQLTCWSVVGGVRELAPRRSTRRSDSLQRSRGPGPAGTSDTRSPRPGVWPTGRLSIAARTQRKRRRRWGCLPGSPPKALLLPVAAPLRAAHRLTARVSCLRALRSTPAPLSRLHPSLAVRRHAARLGASNLPPRCPLSPYLGGSSVSDGFSNRPPAGRHGSVAPLCSVHKKCGVATQPVIPSLIVHAVHSGGISRKAVIGSRHPG
jgi:hypothetical protein